MIPKTFWKSFCGLTRQKWNFLEGVHPVTSGVKLQQHFRTHVKHGGCGVMVLGCFASSGPGRLGAIDGTMNSARYQKILTESVRPSVHHLKLKLTRVMQQDNDPKHTSKSTYEWLKKKQKIKWRFWSGLVKVWTSVQLRCCGMTLKRPFMASPPNVAELKTILQRIAGQNSSTAMWKTHCQLLLTLDCRCCCQGLHNHLLGLGGNYFFTLGQVDLDSFLPFTH